METLLVKFDIPNLSRSQLPNITAPSHCTVVPKLIMMWTERQYFDGSNPGIPSNLT